MSAKKYEKDYKVQSVKLALEVGQDQSRQRTRHIEKYPVWLGQSSQSR